MDVPDGHWWPWNKLGRAAAAAASRGQWGLASELCGSAYEALMLHYAALAAQEHARMVANSGRKIAKDEQDYWRQHFEARVRADRLMRGFGSGRGDD